MTQQDFDPQALAELREDLGEGFADFVSSFLTRLREMQNEMRAAATSAQFDVVAQLAHSLKGTAGYLGATELTRLAGELQQSAGKSPNIERVNELLTRIDAHALLVHQHLEHANDG